MGICSIFCHYQSHGSEVFWMTRRKQLPINSSASSEEELTKEGQDDITVEDTVVPPTLQQP